MGALTTDHTTELLSQVQDPKVKQMAQDVSLVTALTRVLNASLDLIEGAKDGPAGVGLGLAAKGIEIGNMVDTASGGSAALKSVGAVGGIAMSNKALVALSSASPQKAAITLGLVAIQKLTIAGGLQDKYKCEIALGALASTAGLTLVSSPSGIGAVVGAIGTIAAGVDAWNACAGPQSRLPN